MAPLWHLEAPRGHRIHSIIQQLMCHVTYLPLILLHDVLVPGLCLLSVSCHREISPRRAGSLIPSISPLRIVLYVLSLSLVWLLSNWRHAPASLVALCNWHAAPAISHSRQRSLAYFLTRCARATGTRRTRLVAHG